MQTVINTPIAVNVTPEGVTVASAGRVRIAFSRAQFGEEVVINLPEEGTTAADLRDLRDLLNHPEVQEQISTAGEG